MTALRDYQAKAVLDFHQAVAAGRKRVILVAPTGAGKTILGAAIIKDVLVDPRKHVLVLAHRREIITQTAAKLLDHDIRHGIIQAGFDPRPMARVQVASIQTISARTIRSNRLEKPPADLLVIDECHHAPAKSYQDIIDLYPDIPLLGLTATPCRGDGRGLGSIFELIIETPQVAELIAQGYLVKTRVYAPVIPDLRGVRIQAGDYVEAQLAARMDQPKLVGDIVEHWLKYSERRKTVVFAVNVAHSIHITQQFIASGVRAGHIDGSTPKAERDATLARLAAGEIDVVSNCMVLTEGWDLPEVGCCILARPTRKMGLYRQMIGRVLRPAPGKTDAIVLDHSGATYRHGFVEDHIEWTLHPDRQAQNVRHAAREAKGSFASKLIECANCGAVREADAPCFHCGYLPQRRGRDVAFETGDLGLVDGGRRAAAPIADPAERLMWLGMLMAIARERAYKAGWVAHKYKEKFGAYPPWGMVAEPIEPLPEVRRWVRSRQIAFAKGRAA